MTAVIVSLVAVVLLVLVVVALGMRSMNKRESSLPPERLKQMAEKEEMTHARSTDEFAAHEPRMANFSPDFSPIDEVKAPRPVRTGQRGKRGVDEWGNPTSDDEDEEFWANIRSDAEEGGFGAGGTVKARMASSRPVGRERPVEPERERQAERPRERRPVSSTPDPDATTVQAPLPQRTPAKPAPAPAAASAGLADLVEPRPAPSSAELADQRTMTFSAPTPDVMSILGAGAQPVPPPTRSDPLATTNGSGFPAAGRGGSSGSFPAVNGSSGSFPAVNGNSGSFAAVNGSSGSFPAVHPAPIHGAPTSDPFPAHPNGDPLSTTWTGGNNAAWPQPAATRDILDDPGPAATTGPAGSWPAFEPVQPQARNSYEVRSGWAVADDSDPLTGPSPAAGTPTAPSRAVSAYDDVLSGPAPTQPPSVAYETGDFASPAAAWPEPPAANSSWPSYNEMYGRQNEPSAAAPQGSGGRGGHRRAPEQQDYPDYYR